MHDSTWAATGARTRTQEFRRIDVDAAGTEKAVRRPRAAEGRRSATNLDDNATLYGKKLENPDIVNQGVTRTKAAAG